MARKAGMGKKPLNLTEWAYISIKQYIINNKLEPGSQLNIEELALKLNISRTPIREALIRLKQEGMVVAVPRVGFFVCGMTKKEFDELFELRKLIECYAAEQATSRMSDKELNELVKTQEQGYLMAQEGKIKEFNHLEEKLHNSIIDSLHNKRISDVLSGVADLFYKERLVAMGSIENVRESAIEHGKITDAIKARDAELARKMMDEHLSRVKERLEKIMDFQESKSNIRTKK